MITTNTERQIEIFGLWTELGSYAKVAKALGISHQVVHRAVRKVQERALRDGRAPEGYKVKEVSTNTKTGAQSIKVGEDGGDRDQFDYVADPKKIKFTTTMVDGSGRVGRQWVREEADLREREAMWKAFAEELAKGTKRAEPIYALHRYHETANLLACYPVGDAHFGMLAWGKETLGESYDLEIAEDLHGRAAERLMSTAPPCPQALIAFLGDFLHYDSYMAVTPTSRNMLDNDGRYPKMVRVAIRGVRHMIDAARRYHGKVHVIFEIGNHDKASAPFMRELLAAIFENESRVTIDTSPAHFHYYRFGSTLIGTHHGDGVKMPELGSVMAHDRPTDWGETEHRYWWTGHVHHKSVIDGRGWSAESFRVLAPVDAWAAANGYRSTRDMQSIVIDREHGEVARSIVRPAMLRR